MSKWSTLYENEIHSTSVDHYINEKLRTKKKIVKLINKYSRRNHHIVEFGSGTGVLALHISSQNNNKVIAVDKDQDMIDLSKKYFAEKFENRKINFVCKDIRDFICNEKIDVCYSIGVLEHYTDLEIKNLINKQFTFSQFVIFAIPTKYFDENKKMYGDERYLSLSYWRKIIKESNAKILEEASYHYLNFIQRILNIKKYFKPNPVHIFVIAKDKTT